MAGKVLQLESILTPDQMAVRIAEYWQTWSTLRQVQIEKWKEIRNYVYATDTSTTSNNQLPWKNKTTLPKLCQIRDNLSANYTRSLFPKRKWISWEGDNAASEEPKKKNSIEAFMTWAVERSDFKSIVSNIVLDWLDTGNCFATIDWADGTQETATGNKIGYVGPIPVRISPYDIVFNPLSPDFRSSPKIIRSLISLGELKEMLTRMSTKDNEEAMQEVFKYTKDIRHAVRNFTGTIEAKDEFFQVDGFTSYQSYLESDYVEVLTFYGDLYDLDSDTFYKNHVITVIDRHRLIDKRENPSVFGTAQIFHCGWRPRQDNLWAMGPLDNLVGMQYRIDHLENLKADVFDFIAFPVVKIKGYVDDFTWEPAARIQVTDEGDVEVLSPDTQILSANLEIAQLQQQMEEMAGAPKEALGFRTPGEKTKYEVQRLENAASRIFQNKIEMFESEIVEPCLSAMLELGRRRLSTTAIRTVDDEFDTSDFLNLSAQDITGEGRIRPVAARHFAEQAEKIQNATAFFNSQVGQDPDVVVHFSGLEVAKMFEDLLDLEGYKLVTPFVRVSERADTERLTNTQQEQTLMTAQTPSGLTPEDYTSK